MNSGYIYEQVKAVILEPGSRTGDSTKEGIIDSDGEVLARGKGTYKCHLNSLMRYDKLQIVLINGWLLCLPQSKSVLLAFSGPF
ncbi:putative sphingosine kinase [Helianthus annuus]|nr:putative sphingosine kinase [Helianthus annuus]